MQFKIHGSIINLTPLLIHKWGRNIMNPLFPDCSSTFVTTIKIRWQLLPYGIERWKSGRPLLTKSIKCNIVHNLLYRFKQWIYILVGHFIADFCIFIIDFVNWYSWNRCFTMIFNLLVRKLTHWDVVITHLIINIFIDI